MGHSSIKISDQEIDILRVTNKLLGKSTISVYNPEIPLMQEIFKITFRIQYTEEVLHVWVDYDSFIMGVPALTGYEAIVEGCVYAITSYHAQNYISNDGAPEMCLELHKLYGK